MRASEFIRGIAELIARIERDEGDGAEVSTIDNDDETSTFIPPLQQEIEFRKKEIGIQSRYDQDPEEQSDNRSEENRKALVGGN